ncbi:hypothetical protein, partial [Escherichia coli]|uniref:hypothetical protein n=2 Tax=Escherichia coli TaxID=562 RepID=UPI001BD0E68E
MARSAKPRKRKPAPQRSKLPRYVVKLHPDDFFDEEDAEVLRFVNRPGFPGECFICELRLPDHRFRWKHNKLFLLLPVGYGPAF